MEEVIVIGAYAPKNDSVGNKFWDTSMKFRVFWDVLQCS
jgi:hypothetical protein